MTFAVAPRAARLNRIYPPGFRRHNWVCATCARPERVVRRFQSSTTSSPAEKPYYVTTPIFYVNASPHVGHMYSIVLADVHKRWQVLKGKRALLCTGTDEHGMKVQRAAEVAGVPPKQLCDATSETFRTLAARSNVSNDFFIRTTDPAHVAAVTHFWTELLERGYIYQSKHEGWYCVADEAFYPEAAVERRVNPLTGKTFMAAVESGGEVEWTQERNYHFRITALRDRLLEFYRANPDFVSPGQRMNEVVSWVERSLVDDLSISRPADRLSWGIPVPGDATQTIYVWLDALINYATVTGYPDWPSDGGGGGWPADLHVIGKDILRFHCVYWPAMLMALDLPLPRRVLGHAHWTLGKQKMSKSVGNVVNPFFSLDRFGVDVMRYYLVHDGGVAQDADYENRYIVERYKKHLRGGLGNLAARLMRSKLWSVEEAVAAAADGSVDLQRSDGFRKATQLLRLAETADRRMGQLDASGAAKHIMSAVFEGNRYLQKEEPWVLARKKDDASQLKMKEVVYTISEVLRVVGILLQPFMPAKAGELLDMLGVDKSRRAFADAQVGADLSYGKPAIPVGKGDWDGLFPRLAVED